jgi:hypothetical protein
MSLKRRGLDRHSRQNLLSRNCDGFVIPPPTRLVVNIGLPAVSERSERTRPGLPPVPLRRPATNDR